MKKVYINSIGKFLPGKPVSNDEIEEYLGRINGKSSRIKEKILSNNGIKNRYYALDKNQNSLYSNASMTSFAVIDAIKKSGFNIEDISFLAAATTQGDLPVPGFGNMVQGELKMQPTFYAF